MKIISGIAILLFFSIISYNINAQQLAFPGAEGFGKYTTGGRGGTVYHVTNLDDSGPGSFRDAVSQPNRIVVFDVGGVIHISTRIVINKNITIAGQTAPGDGITIYGNGIALNDDSGNNIIRYIRIRMGAGGDSGKDAVGISAGQNYMFDHVSVSWGRDGTFDINGSTIDNVSIQDCIIGQGINKDNHSTGGLMQSGKFSLIRTLFVDNKTRNPKARSQHEFINCVVYNWATDGYILGGSTSATDVLAEANIMGSYFIAGPSSTGGAFTEGTTYFHAYVSNNYLDGNKDGSLNGELVPTSSYAGITIETKSYSYPGVTTVLSALEAYNYVVANAGASKVRDEVDKYLIDELTSLGTKGKIIFDETDNGIPGNVGTVKGGIAKLDTDRDGMPDEWEFYYGFNPNSISDQNLDSDADGYTNIEEYINNTDPGNGLGILPSGLYFIEAKHSEKVLYIEGDIMSDSASVVQYEMEKSPDQAWKIDTVGIGFYSIKNNVGNLAISVDSSSLNNGAGIIQRTYTGSDDQLWKINFSGKGYYSLLNKNSLKALTVPEASLDNNTKLVQDAFLDSSNQNFKMVPYSFFFNPPSVNIELPVDGTMFMQGEDVYIQTEVVDYDGTILKVEFFDGSNKIGKDTLAPYRMMWQNAGSGVHNISVVATDNDSLTTTSTLTKITIIGSGSEGLLIQENKPGFCSLDGTVDNNNAGFSGAGFCNTGNAIGEGIDWKVNITQSGNYTLRFRFANGTGSRPGKILVNNITKVASLDLPGTGSWTTWSETTASILLDAGINAIRLEATTSAGLANIDYLEINGLGIELINCGGFAEESFVYMETFGGIPGSLVDDLYYHTSFPVNPGSITTLNKLESPFNRDNNFGTRIRGFIVPQENGLYTFWISGNEECQLWLSFDTIPSNAVKIASVPGYTDIRQWNKYAVQQSEALTLYKGQKNYFEILHKAGEGDDHVEVAWQGTNIAQSIVSSAYILPWTDTTHKEGVIFTGISLIEKEDIVVYPNPARDFINIELGETNLITEINIYNVNGILLRNKKYNENFIRDNISDLMPGLYLLQISNKKGTYTALVSKY